MKSLLFLSLFLLAGCANFQFEPYTEIQQTWPQDPHGQCRRLGGVDVYYGRPPQPYAVLGRGILTGGDELMLAHHAKKLGADALMIRSDEVVQTGSYHVDEHTTVQYYGNTYGTANTQAPFTPYQPYVTSYSGTTTGTAVATTTPAYDIPINRRVIRATFIRFLQARPETVQTSEQKKEP